MSLKPILLARQTIVVLILVLISWGDAHGQESPIVRRYFVVELDKYSLTEEVEPVASLDEPLRGDLRLLFALKTNLLFDALTAINFEIEAPIARRWSVAAELIFPWWTISSNHEDSRRNRLQIVNGNIEGRYWWSKRADRSPLEGWFTGVYTGFATYDLEYHARGYQGSNLFMVGVSGGYAHPINRAKDLRLEYSLGVGYMTTYYHYYEAEFCNNSRWHAVEIRHGRYRWFGATRAKVSLSWLIDFNIKR